MANMQRYSYRPFPSEREFRLILLSPGDLHDPIRGHVFHSPLDGDSRPPYAALSYAWGCSAKPFQMETRDGAILLTDSLHAALQHLRHQTGYTVLWADAVCIDQENDDEKSHQVRLMKDIYANAEQTCIWLGRARDSTNTATAVIQHLSESTTRRLKNSGGGMHPQSVMDSLAFRPMTLQIANPETVQFPTSKLDAIAEYFASPWFTRIWVVQEVAFSKNAHYICGDAVLPWTTVAFAILEIIRLCLPRKNKSLASAILNQIPSLGIRMAQGIRLSTLLFNLRAFQATEPRDKVYALLGMTNDGDLKHSPGLEIVPDYKKPLPDVYRDTARCIVGIDQNLDVLEAIPHSESSTPRIPVDTSSASPFPSWVPQWDKPEGCSMLARRDPQFRAAGDYPLEVGEHRSPNILALAGQRVDKVAKTSPGPTAASLASVKESILSIWKEHASTLRCYPTGESVLAAFSNTLVAGRSPDGGTAAADPRHGADVAAYFGQLGNQNAASSPAEEGSVHDDALGGSSARYATFASTCFVGRRFFTTENGYMGLCPATSQEGDVMCILYGCRFPIVLRSAGKYFHFLGVSYVHGWMEGEYLEQQIQLHKPTEMFNLC